MANFFAEVKEDPETKDVYLEIPLDLLKEMGWADGTELNIAYNNDGSVSLTKSN